MLVLSMLIALAVSILEHFHFYWSANLITNERDGIDYKSFVFSLNSGNKINISEDSAELVGMKSKFIWIRNYQGSWNTIKWFIQ